MAHEGASVSARRCTTHQDASLASTLDDLVSALDDSPPQPGCEATSSVRSCNPGASGTTSVEQSENDEITWTRNFMFGGALLRDGLLCQWLAVQSLLISCGPLRSGCREYRAERTQNQAVFQKAAS
jgi:hypothetical protein